MRKNCAISAAVNIKCKVSAIGRQPAESGAKVFKPRSGDTDAMSPLRGLSVAIDPSVG